MTSLRSNELLDSHLLLCGLHSTKLCSCPITSRLFLPLDEGIHGLLSVCRSSCQAIWATLCIHGSSCWASWAKWREIVRCNELVHYDYVLPLFISERLCAIKKSCTCICTFGFQEGLNIIDWLSQAAVVEQLILHQLSLWHKGYILVIGGKFSVAGHQKAEPSIF